MGRELSGAALEQIVPDVKATFLSVATDEERVDLLGDIRSVEQGLAALRKSGASEIEAGTTGTRWEFRQGRAAKRSYNTPQLLHKIADAMGVSTWEAFVTLFRGDVLRISWQWSKLNRVLDEYRVTTVTARHEIEEGDEADIGEYWKDGYPSYERIAT